MRTIDTVDTRPQVLDPPPLVTDEGPAPKPKVDVAQPDAPPPPTEADEQFRAAMPFAPAIAMDPVDGSKISMRIGTPEAEYKGHIYYFSSEDNKRTFVANPDQFTKGVFSHL
jgi:YHS domain-containing protein